MSNALPEKAKEKVSRAEHSMHTQSHKEKVLKVKARQ
jgi:hypothetical protein